MNMTINLSIGPQVRKSPFFEATCRDGLASASVYNHMYLPTSYGDPIAEYQRLTQGVAMWDVAIERQVALRGKDSVRLAGMLTGRNLDSLRIGQGKYAPVCNYEGCLINDPVLLQVEDNEIWLSIADSDIKLWAAGVAGALQMDVDVFEPDVSPLAIQGPKAELVAVDLFGAWVSELSYFGFQRATLGSIPVIVARSGWSKQGGFEIYLLDGQQGTALWDLVKEAGSPHGIGPGTPCYIERLESGLISYATDTDDQSNVFELGLDRFIDLDGQIDFIGKSELRKIREKGVTRLFKGFLIDGSKFKSLNDERWPIEWNGSNAGYVSAAAFSPRLQSNIAVGIVSVEAIASGEPVDILCGDTKRSAKISDLPLI